MTTPLFHPLRMLTFAQYINKTFTLAAPNLSINGLPIASPEPFLNSAAPNPDAEYEPFDTRKRRRVAELITQEERLLEDVAALKRSVPARAAAEHAELWKEALQRDQAAVEDRAAQPAEEVKVDVELLERQDGVEERWRNAVEGLVGLKREMPSVVAKMERARVAGEYVITEGR